MGAVFLLITSLRNYLCVLLLMSVDGREGEKLSLT